MMIIMMMMMTMMIFIHDTLAAGAYASECENILGQIRNGFIGDVVLVDPDIVRDNELLYGLVPDAVLVGGRVEFISTDSAVKVVRYCSESTQTPPLWNAPPPHIAVPGAEADLSNSVYLPGKGGELYLLVACTLSMMAIRLL